MCIRPIHIKVKRATITDGCVTRVAVPCGHCYQCKRKRQRDYYLRAYYQSLYCFRHGGFILFDTLTYSDAHLPHISDFLVSDKFDWSKHQDLNYSCFNSAHVRNFFKVLRQRLVRTGYEVSGNLKYFLSSEYGTDERFTHRPHYHIMFYCQVPDLTPLVLSSFISDCWQYGRTDGFKYKSSSYVLSHNTFGNDYNTSITEALTCCEYVSKYVTKDSSFEVSVNYRLHALSNHFLVDDVKKVINPFIRISAGFGESILEVESIDDIIKNDAVRVPDKKNVVRSYSLPAYYRRKLFYDTIRYVVADDKGDFKSKVTYSVNDVGYAYLVNRFELLRTKFSNSYRDFLHTFRVFVEQNNSTFGRQLLRDMVNYSNSPLFFDRLARYSIGVHGRTFLGVLDSDIQSLDIDTLKRLYVTSNYFEDSFLVRTDINGQKYIGSLLPDSFGVAAVLLKADLPLFACSAVLLSSVENEGNFDNSSLEFAYFNAFLRCYEVANYFIEINANENFKRKEHMKKRYKSIYSLLNI